MKHLVHSFQEHVGERGCHFYDDEHCRFLSWKQVFQFVDALPEQAGKTDEFAGMLTEKLANYDPDTEFLAVQQSGDEVSVELYSQAQ